jgi:hypothetical protein
MAWIDMTRTSPRPLVALLLLLALVLGMVVLAPPPSAEASSSAEQDFVQRLNRERTNRGLPALQVASDLRSVARNHSDRMASQNRLHHNPNLSTEVKNWRRITENVGRGPSTTSLHAALMASSGHRANILDRNVSQVGVGVTVRNGTVWVTQVFRSPTGSAVLSGSSSSSSSSSVSPFAGGLSDVVVAGRPSERWGSEVVAIVKLREEATPDETALTSEAAKHIARYKLPKSYVFSEEIVRSPSGKADYRWAKEQATTAS